MSSHRLPERESSGAPAFNKEAHLWHLEVAARLILRGAPLPDVASSLGLDLETFTTLRESPEWRSAYGRAAKRYLPSISANLKWVASDRACETNAAAAMFVVAADIDDERVGRWWIAHAPKPSVFNWNTLQPLVHRERRRADFGPGWERAAKGQDVDFEDRHADDVADAAAVTIARDCLERIARVASKAQWRAVERIKAGQKLSNADDNALYHLRRKLERLGLKADWSTA
jgi:hypothetical protein